jgi:hypothetical protein
VLGISVFWDVSYITTLHYPEYGNNKISRNNGKYIPVCIASSFRVLVPLCHDDFAVFSKLKTASQAI